jgi:hypothetical protein
METIGIRDKNPGSAALFSRVRRTWMMKRIGAGCGAAEHSSRVRARTSAKPDISLSENLKTRLHQFILNNKFTLLCLNFAGNIFKGKSY